MARILIAEDEEALRSFVARALAQDGHEVLVTADGAEALDLMIRDGGRFDLLLADVRMPVMDGIALALAVARDYPEAIILLMTGYADQRERARPRCADPRRDHQTVHPRRNPRRGAGGARPEDG